MKKFLKLPAQVYTLAPDIERAGERIKPRPKFKFNYKPWLFLLPALALIAFWLYRPLAETVYYAFHSWGMVPGTVPRFVGISNFTKLLTSKDFFTSIGNTVFYIVGLLPFSVIIPLFLASATNDLPSKAKNFYRALFFIPMIMAPVATATIWRWLLNPSSGLINQLIVGLGISDTNISFFLTEGVARMTILLITGWKMIGFSTLMFSAALTGINRDYFEAARLDGASKLRQFTTITLPLISPTVIFMMMMSILFASQWTFAYIDLLTQGGPYGTTTNIYYEMYKYGFSSLNVGMSSASAVIFFIIFGIIALLLNRLSARFVFYDN